MTNRNFDSCNSCKRLVPAVYMSYASQNLCLSHVSNCSKLSIFFCSCIRGQGQQASAARRRGVSVVTEVRGQQRRGRVRRGRPWSRAAELSGAGERSSKTRPTLGSGSSTAIFRREVCWLAGIWDGWLTVRFVNGRKCHIALRGISQGEQSPLRRWVNLLWRGMEMEAGARLTDKRPRNQSLHFVAINSRFSCLSF